MKLFFKIFLVVVVGAFFAGCTVHQPVIEETGHYYFDDQYDISSLSSVTIAELENNTNYASVSKVFSETFVNTIKKKHLFTLRTLGKDDPLWKQIMDNKFQTVNNDELKKIRSGLKTNGLMFGSVSEYKPYPRRIVAINLKLIDLRTGRLVWCVEQVWDSTDKSVEKRIQRFYKNYMRSGYDPMDWEFVRVSPKMFNKFVSYEICATLPSNSYYDPEFVDSRRGVKGMKNRVLRPVVRFPSQVGKVVGLNDN